MKRGSRFSGLGELREVSLTQVPRKRKWDAGQISLVGGTKRTLTFQRVSNSEKITTVILLGHDRLYQPVGSGQRMETWSLLGTNTNTWQGVQRNCPSIYNLKDYDVLRISKKSRYGSCTSTVYYTWTLSTSLLLPTGPQCHRDPSTTLDRSLYSNSTLLYPKLKTCPLSFIRL